MEKIVGEGVGFERIRRVTGYLSGDVKRFNNAKRAEERQDDLYAAIDKVTDKIERQIRKNKTRNRLQYFRPTAIRCFSIGSDHSPAFC